MKKNFPLFVLPILLLGCALFSPTPSPTPPLVPTAETPNPLPEPTDRTQVLTVKASAAFDIVLPSNPSTGYRWQLVTPPDANFIQSTGQTYLPEQPVMPGSGGVDVWTFNALAPGETKIEFGYYPPGDTTQPDETAIFTIRIE